MTPADARERVARGAALLDEKRPGWAERIDLPTLSMASDCMCVLGQLEGSFWRVVFTLFGKADSSDNTPLTDALLCGFWFDGPPESVTEYGLLQDAWIEAITVRLPPPVQWTHREPVMRETRVTPTDPARALRLPHLSALAGSQFRDVRTMPEREI